MVNGEFFLSLSCQHPGNLFQPSEVLDRSSCSVCGSFKKLTKHLTGNSFGCYGAKATIKSRDEYIFLNKVLLPGNAI